MGSNFRSETVFKEEQGSFYKQKSKATSFKPAQRQEEEQQSIFGSEGVRCPVVLRIEPHFRKQIHQQQEQYYSAED